MRKVFILASLMLAAFVCRAQPITDTGALRYYINSTIVPNGNRQITAAQLNRILNGTINVMPWGGSGKASYGLRKTGDTTVLGGKITGMAGIIIPNRQTTGSFAGNLLFTNRETPDSLCIECTPTGSGSNVSGSITESPTYNTPQLSITTAYREAWGDLVSPQQYGGAIEIDTRRIYKATGSAHSVAGGGVVQMPVAGLGVHNRIYLPNDSTVTPNWWDGTNCTIRGNMDVGLPGGYLWNIPAPTSYTPQSQPHYQVPVYSSQVDLQRQSPMTGRRKLVGAGIAGYQSMFKSEQRTLNTGQTNLHHDIDAPLVGFNAVGMVDNDLRGSGVTTKTQILDRSRVGNAYGFRAAAMRRPFNEVDNGYGFVAVGDSDVNHFAGPTRVGGSLPYWNAGVLTQQRMFEVYGASYADSVYGGIGAKLYTDGNSADRRFWIYPSGSNVRMIFGRGGNESATMQIAGTDVGSGYDNKGGISFTTRTYNQGTGYERSKFIVAVDDVGTFMRKMIIDKDNISFGYNMAADPTYTGLQMQLASTGLTVSSTSTFNAAATFNATTTINAFADIAGGGVRVQSRTFPVSGTGIEFGFNVGSQTGEIYTYDRTNSQYKAMGFGVSSNQTYLASDGNVGIGTSSPSVKLDVAGSIKGAGSLRLAYTLQSANYSITTSDHFVECTANSPTFTLPTATGNAGLFYVVTNSGAGTLVLETSGSQVIGNSGSSTSINVTSGTSVTVSSNGSAWRVN